MIANMTVLLPSEQAFEDDAQIVAWVYFADNLSPIHFQIWREEISPEYRLVATTGFTPRDIGYHHVLVSATAEEEIYVQRGDIIGISFSTPPTPLAVASCSYSDIDDVVQTRLPFLYTSDRHRIAGQVSSFSSDDKCLTHFVEAVVQYLGKVNFCVSLYQDVFI